MKGVLSFMFVALLLAILEIGLVSTIDPKWRRFEFIISGLKDTARRGYGRQRFAELTVNNKKTFNRQLKSFPVDTDIDDDFVAQHVVNSYDPIFDTGNYFFSDVDLDSSAFEEPLVFGFHVFFTDLNNINQTIVRTVTTQDYRVAANADRLIRMINLSPQVTFDLYVSYRCHGYNGLGCRFLCNVGPDVPYECLYDSNEMICKDPNFNNPPLCNINNSTCVVNPCRNGGRCVRVINNITFCECRPGYMGDTCNVPFCEDPCDPDFGECVGPNTCRCDPGWGGRLCDQAFCDPNSNPCANNGSCGIVNNEVICECDPSRFAGKTCSMECNPACIFGTCLQIGLSPVCQCFEGFVGDTCNQTIPEPEPIFEDGYLSLRQQRIIYVAVTAGVIFIAVIVFGIGSYQRTHKKRDMRIMKGAETAMRTLQMNQQLSQTLSNAQLGQMANMKPMMN